MPGGMSWKAASLFLCPVTGVSRPPAAGFFYLHRFVKNPRASLAAAMQNYDMGRYPTPRMYILGINIGF